MKSTYSASSIKIISRDTERVRCKPAFYIGVPPSSRQAHHQIAKELLDNAFDEAQEGYNSFVGISIDKDYIYVWDKGRGIPVEINKTEKISTLTAVFCRLHSGGKLDKTQSGYKKGSRGTHGVGACVSNALCKEFEVFTFRNNKWYTQLYSKGIEQSKVYTVSKLPKIPNYDKKLERGTLIRYKVDTTIVAHKQGLDTNSLNEWFKIQAYLCPKVKIVSIVNGKKKVFYQPDGLKSLLSNKIKDLGAEPSGKPFVLRTDNVDIALRWSTDSEERIEGYVNGSPTSDVKSTQLLGIYKVITEALLKYKGARSKYRPEDLRCGLVGIVNIYIQSPEFDSQSKSKLVSKEATDIVIDNTLKPLEKFFSENKALARLIIQRANEVRELNQQFSMSKKVAASLRTSKNGKQVFPVKLVQSTTKNPFERELFIVEGDSAGGSAKKARNSYNQEVLPLRGKIFNSVKDTKGKIFESEEVISILKSIGYDPVKKSSNLRVGKIVLLSDADVDGPLGGETRVHTLDGKLQKISTLYKKIQNGKKIHVWARNKKGEFIPAPVLGALKINKNTYLKVTLDDGTVINMTKNHRQFIYKNRKLTEVKAKELKIGDSIPAKYIVKANSDRTGIGCGEYNCLGRYYLKSARKIVESRNQVYARDIYGKPLTVEEPLHHIVARCFYPKEWEKRKNNSNLKKGLQIQVDHINRIKTDNRPENIQLLTQSKHGKKDATISIIKYNKSDKHKKVVIENNSKEEFIEQQSKGRLARYYGQLLREFDKVTSKTWDANIRRTNQIVPNWKNIKSSFTSIVKLYKKLDSKDVGKLLTKKEVKSRMNMAVKNRNSEWVNNTIKLLKKNKLPVSPKGLMKLKSLRKGLGKRTIGWKFIKNELSNHKISSIEEIKEKKNFYCLSVPSCGNFYIADKNGNALLTGNCHINLLVLAAIVKIMPELIKQGKVFIIDAPLFMNKHGNKVFFAKTLQAAIKLAPKGTITRIKGWGEANPEELKTIAFDPKQRTLTKVTMKEAKEMTRFLKIMGEDVNERKTLLGI